MAHIGTADTTHTTTSRGGGGDHQSFGLLAVALSAAAAMAGLMLPAAGLAALSTALVLAGFALAVVAWRRQLPLRPEGVRVADIAALLVLLGFIGALIGDTEALFH